MTKKQFTGLVSVVVGAVLVLWLFVRVTITERETVRVETPVGAAEFNTGKIVHSNLSDQIEVRRTVVVSPSDINGASGLENDENGITLIPSVGAGKVIVVNKIVGFSRFSSESWDMAGGPNAVASESFEVKWYNGSQRASGGNGYTSLGASFSRGFLTSGANNVVASRSVEVWTPSAKITGSSVGTASVSFEPVQYASSSAVILTGLVDPTNIETSGITDFVFEVFYKVLSDY